MLKSEQNFWRRFSPMQLVLAGTAALIVLFLIIGAVTQSSGPQPQFQFGIQTQPFLLLALLAFAAGLLSFASPCTLPILPAYFAFAFQSGRKQIALNTLVFMLGLATMFSLMGAGASAIGQTLRQSQYLLLLLGGAVVLIFGVMSLLGKGFGGFQQRQETQTHSRTLGGSYLFGLTFAVGWSSCVGPILGAVLTMAATTSSVTQGMILLFIYTLGLGLPLILVSTLFGRASRQSLLWRALRGKGWQVETHVLAVTLIWAVAIGYILIVVADYAALNSDLFSGQSLTSAQQVGLGVIVLLGALLWTFTNPDGRRVVVNLHSTQIISGVLLILLGVLMLSGTLAAFNSLIPPDLALWFIDLEEGLVEFFTR
jgi:cytochrome c-type biogenesis protein